MYRATWIAKDKQFLETLAERSQRPVLHNAIAVVDGYPDAHKRSIARLYDCNARGLRIYGHGATGRIWFEYTFEDWNLYDFSPPWNHATQGTPRGEARQARRPRHPPGHEGRLPELHDRRHGRRARDDHTGPTPGRAPIRHGTGQTRPDGSRAGITCVFGTGR